jgi:hypothetical protein
MSKQAGKFTDGQDQHVAPLAVTSITASNVAGQGYNAGIAALSWTLPSNSNPATLYTVTSTPATTTQTSASTSLNFSGLASGQDYTFTIVPSNSYGSGPSATSSSLTITTIPQAPTIGTATDQGSGRPYNQGQVQVTFTANANGGAAIDSYAVNAFDTSGNYLAQVTGSSSPLTFTTLSTTQTYKFAAYSHNANGYSAASSFSNNVSPTTVPDTPSAPSGSSPSTSQETVTWSAPANGGSAITGYVLYIDGVSQGNIGNVTSYTVNSLGMGSSHTYNVAAINANGTGGTSAASASLAVQFSFAPFGFTPFGFTPFGFTPFGFTPFGFTPFGFVPTFGFAPSKCIHEDTLVSTPKGLIRAADIQAGDRIYSINIEEVPNTGTDGQAQFDYSGFESTTLRSTDGLVETIVMSAVRGAKDHIMYFNGEEAVKFSLEQPMFVKRNNEYEILPSGVIEKGDYLLKIDDQGQISEILVEQIDIIEGASMVVLFDCEPQDWFIAGGYLVHNK